MELLREKDFAQYTDEERAVRAAVARIAARAPQRTTRRSRPTRRRRDAPDLRATVRASLRRPASRWSAASASPAQKPRRIVLVCDVSGSMAPYARMLLQYLQAAVAARRRVEVFAFGTRLTRLTRELGVRDPDLALARAGEAVEGLVGQPGIGHSLGVLNREYGRRLGRGAVVVILSDGWDRGEPEVLADEMARLRRSSHRVVWLNPLKAAGRTTSRWRAGWPRPCPTPIISWPGTRWHRWRSWPRSGRGETRDEGRSARRRRLDRARRQGRDRDGGRQRGQALGAAAARREDGDQLETARCSGAVSGGCVEGAVIEVAEEVMAAAASRAC